MPTKAINVPMEEALHRQFKAVSVSVGVSEKDLLLRCFIFASTLGSKRVHAIVTDGDGNELDFPGIMRVTLNGNKETRELLRSIDALGNRLRELESFVYGCSTSKSEDYPDLRREAVRLASSGPWKDPKY